MRSSIEPGLEKENSSPKPTGWTISELGNIVIARPHMTMFVGLQVENDHLVGVTIGNESLTNLRAILEERETLKRLPVSAKFQGDPQS